eukprot:Clim_evm12s64 gene=Clim_evmTU12s64
MGGAQPSKTETMRAACYEKHGGADTRTLREDYPKPMMGKGQVLVKIMAAGTNPVDYKLNRGDVPAFTIPKPKIFGGDLAGIIEDCHENSKFKKGDKVYGMMEYKYTRWGSYAEFAAVKETELAPMPRNLSYPEAACLPLVCLTTLQAMRRGGITDEHKDEIKGRSILIHAGSGGVGSVAIQLAKHFGLNVVTTCSAKNADYVKSLGADRVIDYQTQDFEDELKEEKVDYVFDVMGAEIEAKSQRIIKHSKDGAYMTILTNGMFKYFENWGIMQKPAAYTWGFGHYAWRLSAQYVSGPKFSITVVDPSGDDMAYVTELVENGELKPQLGRVHDFENFNDALEEVATGHVRGKVAVRIVKE